MKEKGKIYLVLGIFIILFQAGPAFGATWVTKWAKAYYDWEQDVRERAGRFMSRDVGKYFTPLLFWERAVSEWNPIGNAMVPIEDMIPGLDIRGKIGFDSKFSLHGNIAEGKFLSRTLTDPKTGRALGIDPRTGRLAPAVGPIRPIRAPTPAFPTEASHRDVTVQDAAWAFQLETDYKPNPHFRFDTIWEWRYNAAYDWDDKFAKFYTPTRRREEQQHWYTFSNILREAFITLTYDPWEITLGKQQEPWGKMISRVLDIFSPDFYATGVDESGRNPLWSANFKYYFGPAFIQYLFIPDYEPERVGESGTVRPQNRSGRDPLSPVRAIGFRASRPGDGFDNATHGFRIGIQKAGWEADLAYIYGWTQDTLLGASKLSSSTFVRGLIVPPGRPDPRTNPILVFTQKKATRVHHIGFDVVKTFYGLYRDWTIRLENVLTLNAYQAVARSSEEPWLEGRIGPFQPRILDPNGWKKKTRLTTGFEFGSNLFRDFGWSFTWISLNFFDYDSTLRDRPIGEKIHRMDSTFFFTVRKPFYTSRITPSFDIFWTNHGDDIQTSTSLDFSLSDYLRLFLRFRFWQGGNMDDGFAQHGSSDHFQFGLTYSF